MLEGDQLLPLTITLLTTQVLSKLPYILGKGPKQATSVEIKVGQIFPILLYTYSFFKYFTQWPKRQTVEFTKEKSFSQRRAK